MFWPVCSPDADHDDDSSPLSLILGVIFGVIGGVILLIVLIILYRKYKGRNTRDPRNETHHLSEADKLKTPRSESV